MRHEKEGDGADDDNGDSDEDEHSDDGLRSKRGEFLRPKDKFSRIGVIARAWGNQAQRNWA